ncbi:hypothetical protein FI667_g1550, partial [Globisporangium splendens]
MHVKVCALPRKQVVEVTGNGGPERGQQFAGTQTLGDAVERLLVGVQVIGTELAELEAVVANVAHQQQQLMAMIAALASLSPQQTPQQEREAIKAWPANLRSLANISVASLYYQFLHEGLNAVPLDRKNHALRYAQCTMRIARLVVSGTEPPPLASLVTDAERAAWRREVQLLANDVQIKVLGVLESHDPGTDNVGKRSRTGTVTGIVRAWTKTVKHANA